TRARAEGGVEVVVRRFLGLVEVDVSVLCTNVVPDLELGPDEARPENAGTAAALLLALDLELAFGRIDVARDLGERPARDVHRLGAGAVLEDRDALVRARGGRRQRDVGLAVEVDRATLVRRVFAPFLGRVV